MAWIIGSLLAGITGLLLAPLTTLNTTDLTIIVIEALGAALIGGLTSLGWTFTGGILLGVAQSLLSLHALNLPDGAKDVLMLAVILAVLLLRREVRTLAISTAGGVGMSITVRPRHRLPRREIRPTARRWRSSRAARWIMEWRWRCWATT